MASSKLQRQKNEQTKKSLAQLDQDIKGKQKELEDAKKVLARKSKEAEVSEAALKAIQKKLTQTKNDIKSGNTNASVQDKLTQLKKKEKEVDDIHKITVSELTKYINEENTDRLLPLINKVTTVTSKPKNDHTVDIPLNVKTENGLTEDVSDLNGLVIPAMYEQKKTGKHSALEVMFDVHFKFANKTTQELIKKKFGDTIKSDNSVAKYLFMGNSFIALSENIHSKLNQITNYNWLTPEMIKQCHKNLSSNIGDNAIYEYQIGNCEDDNGKFYQFKTNSYGTIEIRGRIDAYDDEILWEIKCVSSLQLEHLLQIIIYAWIWEKCMRDKIGVRQYKILNIRTREIRTITYENYIIDEIMNILFENKYSKKNKESDEDFIKKCKSVREKHMGKKIGSFDDSDQSEESSSESDSDDGCGQNMFFSSKKILEDDSDDSDNEKKKPTKKSSSKKK
jgi:hypothetical protein